MGDPFLSVLQVLLLRTLSACSVPRAVLRHGEYDDEEGVGLAFRVPLPVGDTDVASRRVEGTGAVASDTEDSRKGARLSLAPPLSRDL